jgi:hypothetical protein
MQFSETQQGVETVRPTSEYGSEVQLSF